MRGWSKRSLAAIVAAAGLLASCTDYGYGGGQVSLGYGAGGYYDDYYGYGGYGGYGYAGSGWFGGYYYPGSGYYVYDRGGQRHRWNDQQRQHWAGRQDARRDFRADRRDDRQGFRRERRDDRQALRQGTVTRDAFRADRAQDRQSFRADRQAARETFRARRGAGAGDGAPRTFERRERGGGRGMRQN